MDDVNRYWVYQLVENRPPSSAKFVAEQDFDAQRLRADTAEARVKTAEHDLEFFKAGKNEQFDRAEAAEQRIAILIKALKDIRENSDDIGACECAADALKEAALNQKSEGESQ